MNALRVHFYLFGIHQTQEIKKKCTVFTDTMKSDL